MIASRGMGAISPSKVPKRKKRRDDTDFLSFAEGGLWDNIHAKRKRIAQGSGERMRKPGEKGAPTAQAFKDSAR